MNDLSVKILMYAIGAGAGHLTRSLALARAILRSNASAVIHVVASSKLARQPWIQKELDASNRLSIKVFGPEVQPEDIQCYLARSLYDGGYDAMVVDTFPRGICGELIEFQQVFTGQKILIHRDINSRYIDEYRLQEYVQEFYDLMISPGEEGPLVGGIGNVTHVSTAPFLIRNDSELYSCSTAKYLLGAPNQHVIGVVASGRQHECSELLRTASKLRTLVDDRAAVITFNAHSSSINDPTLQYMNGIDMIVGAGGYNTFWETQMTKTPFRGFAFKRMYDEQHKRLNKVQRVHDLESASTSVCEWLESCQASNLHWKQAKYTNGAIHAAAVIQKYIKPKLANY